jgi:hypothetical protein
VKSLHSALNDKWQIVTRFAFGPILAGSTSTGARLRKSQYARTNERNRKTMMLHIYTIIHTLISLVAIVTGLVVVFGMLAGDRLDVSEGICGASVTCFPFFVATR